MPKPKIRQVNSTITLRAGSWLYSQLPARSVMVLFTCLIFGFGILSRLGGVWVDARTKAGQARQSV